MKAKYSNSKPHQMPQKLPRTHTSKTRQTGARKAALVAALRESGNISYACEAAGVDRRTHYRWISIDHVYAAEVADALTEAGDKFQYEARNRAIVGWDEPLHQQGMLVGVIRRKSDAPQALLLRGAIFETYGNRGKVSGSIHHDHAPSRCHR
jgi:hypothetical protein